jgi:hypothetical protein
MLDHNALSVAALRGSATLNVVLLRRPYLEWWLNVWTMLFIRPSTKVCSSFFEAKEGKCSVAT